MYYSHNIPGLKVSFVLNLHQGLLVLVDAIVFAIRDVRRLHRCDIDCDAVRLDGKAWKEDFAERGVIRKSLLPDMFYSSGDGHCRQNYSFLVSLMFKLGICAEMTPRFAVKDGVAIVEKFAFLYQATRFQPYRLLS